MIPTHMIEVADCWYWTGATNHAGYGQFTTPAPKKTYRAHRYVYEQLVGPIPEGLQLDHLCRVRHCVNPDHLEPVTPAVNALRRFGSPSMMACGHSRVVQYDSCRHCRLCRYEAAPQREGYNGSHRP